MTVQPNRDQLRALADKATPGPWEVKGDELAGTGVAHCCMPPDPEDRADMEFIAAARTALPRLLDQLDAAEQRIRDLTQEVRDERGAARDQMEQVRIRDARIAAVEDALEAYAYTGIYTGQERVAVADIRRALER